MKNYDVTALGELLIDFTENGETDACRTEWGKLSRILRKGILQDESSIIRFRWNVD